VILPRAFAWLSGAVVGACINAISPLAAAELTASIEPSAGAELCASLPGSPDAPRCAPCSAGKCRLDVPDGWAGVEVAIEAKAPDYFSDTRAGRTSEAMAFRLTPLPVLDWKGWSPAKAAAGRPGSSPGPAPAADVDWLPADRREEWRPVARAVSPRRIVLPGAARAVRLTPNGGGSPHTVFSADPRAAFGTVGPLPVQAGGEIAACLDVRVRRRPAQPIALRIRDSAKKEIAVQTGLSGCFAADGLPPGTGSVIAEPSALYRIEPIQTRVAADRSAWLGTMIAVGPAELHVRVEDTDATRAYSVTVESSIFDAASQIRVVARITAETPHSWELPAAEYQVSLHPESIAASDTAETITLAASEERTVSFTPRFHRVAGIASRGSTPLVRSPLSFEREETSGRVLTLRLTTGEDGSYAGWFGQPGGWQVLAGGDSHAGGTARPIRIVVPDAPESTLDIRFPAGAVSCTVVSAKTGKSMGPVPLRATVSDTEGGREFTTGLTSDRDGRFRLDALPDARVTIGVPDAIASAMRVRAGTRAVVDVSGDSEQTAELRLEPIDDGGRLTVVDRAGMPIAGAQALRADQGPMGAVLGWSDDRGEVLLPNDLPAGAPIYLVVAAHPWAKTIAPAPDDPARTVMMDDPRREPAVLRFEPSTGSPPVDLYFRLTDAAGAEVPVFFHLLRQGVPPTAHGGTAVIPQPGEGAYTVWVRGAKSMHALGTIVLPSAAPVILDLDACGADCSAR